MIDTNICWTNIFFQFDKLYALPLLFLYQCFIFVHLLCQIPVITVNS